MTEAKKTGKKRQLEVLVSFDGLNKGERFSEEEHDDRWVNQHLENGYLQDVTGEPTAEETWNAGEVGQG